MTVKSYIGWDRCDFREGSGHPSQLENSGKRRCEAVESSALLDRIDGVRDRRFVPLHRGDGARSMAIMAINIKASPGVIEQEKHILWKEPYYTRPPAKASPFRNHTSLLMV